MIVHSLVRSMLIHMLMPANGSKRWFYALQIVRHVERQHDTGKGCSKVCSPHHFMIQIGSLPPLEVQIQQGVSFMSSYLVYDHQIRLQVP